MDVILNGIGKIRWRRGESWFASVRFGKICGKTKRGKMKSWNEIRKAATVFSKRWRTAYDEKSQAQSFLKEFFGVFGIDAVAVATFEHRVKFIDGSQGYADCFWRGKILVEMKSRGRDLDEAFGQAMEYVRSLPDVSEFPRAIVVSDFARIRFYDLAKDNALTEFALKDLRKFVTLFGFLTGLEEETEIREQDPVNSKAAEKMARLHDAMKSAGYTGHPLEVYLVRLLFCLFAEDTGIFKPSQFAQFVKQKTKADGSDLAPQLALLFDTLNRQTRLANLDETVDAFPYVNGGLFAEALPMAAFSAEMRTALLDCATLDWSKISPAIFGAMFQGVMDEKERHDLGAHYTSEENILKLIRPLFLDALREEFSAICSLKGKTKEVRLNAFHERMATLTFLDPACGCGNFLLIAYRELRRLEMDVLEELYKGSAEQFLDIAQLFKVSVSQFYGIEIEPFPAEIAKVALWLMDHLCNMEAADRFGQYFVRIPIKDAAHIVCANALTTDWGSLVRENSSSSREAVNIPLLNSNSKLELNTPTYDYIMGNPPFLGFTYMNAEQKADMLRLFPDNKNLDFVCGWYKKACDLIQGTDTRCAFVSTNSITQGETAAFFWPNINVEIDFAYRTFKWKNEAKGNAAVHCVIIGFRFNTKKSKLLSLRGDSEIRSLGEAPEKTPNLQNSKTPSSESNNSASLRLCVKKIIYDSDGTAIPASNINGYLMDAPDVIVESRNKPLCDVPPMVYGNKPTDGGYLIFTPEERETFLTKEPQAECFMRPLLGAEEFINGKIRYCLWLHNADPTQIRKCPEVLKRVEAVRNFRLASKAAATRAYAPMGGLFRQITQPEGKDYIAIPRVSSEKREYIPIGFLTAETKVTDLVQIIPDASLYHFGILTSRMHNAWMRAVAGRLEMRYRYSKDIVYNNFIWPETNLETTEYTENTEKKSSVCSVTSVVEKITQAAQAVLDARAAHPGSTLADLYDPLAMPVDLRKAHDSLDALVDKAYGLKPSCSDAERVAHLFKLYADAIGK